MSGEQKANPPVGQPASSESPRRSQLYADAWALAREMTEIYKSLVLCSAVHEAIRENGESVLMNLDDQRLWDVAIAAVGIANKDIRMADAQKLKDNAPASVPQKNYIKDLLAQGKLSSIKDVKTENIDKLTAAEASELISKGKGR